VYNEVYVLPGMIENTARETGFMSRNVGSIAIYLALVILLTPGIVIAESFKFASLGDSRGGDNGINEPILTELVTVLIAEGVDLILFSGDLVNDGTESELRHWVEVFMDPLQAAGISVYPCRGNHDRSVTDWNIVFSGDHALPANGPTDELNLTYSVSHKNALFLLTNSSSYLPDYAWMAEKLETNPLPHAFVVNHYPAFAVDHADSLALYPAQRDGIWNMLYESGCPTFFCGHDHFYDHAQIQDASGNWVHQYITGTAGAPPYDWNGNYYDPRVQGVDHYKNYGYALVKVNGFDVTITFKQRISPGVYEATDDVFSYRTPKALPGAQFSVENASGDLPLNVLFLDESTTGIGTITEWLWNFGDGDTSTDRNPIHPYNSHGTFTVTLTVTNEYGSDTVSQPVVLTDAVPVLDSNGMLVLVFIIILTVSRLHFRTARKHNKA
jgi:hypothetical protein